MTDNNGCVKDGFGPVYALRESGGKAIGGD
jgi:hypothetical protein